MRLYTLLFTLVFTATATFAQVSSLEKQALLDLYTATDGEQWNKSWDVNTPVANWYGVTVTNNKVTEINLMFNNLKGEIPNSIGNLKNINKLELSFNQLDGTLPESLGKLKELEILAINGNQIEGSIPSSIGNIATLKQLHLSSNQLSGTLPVSLGELSNLEILNVFDNSLSGTMPYAISESKKLEKLIIAENEIIVNENLAAEVLLFKVDNENTLFKTPNSFISKTVIAVETSDDDDD